MAIMALQPNVYSPIAPVAGTRGLLRFSTAGSVDDGKSTMIGRLLYDAQSVYEDQLMSIQKSGINRADGPIDFSLLTDGLRAEREQGITIDVAYRYFSTAKRKFIIADTPGHEQYTRNMATGASTADAAIILIDARKGLLPQSRRHTYIASLLGIRYVIAAVNKMDLVDYREEVFREIAREFQELAARLGVSNVYPLPISALKGDGVVARGDNMPWFQGPPLLEHLESLPTETEVLNEQLRLPIQYVIRPNAHFRGFAGRIASGCLRKGAKVVALPSSIHTRIRSITVFADELSHAGSESSITFTLDDEIDLSRGDLLVAEGDTPKIASRLRASLVWLHPEPGSQGQDYLLKHTTRIVRARLQEIFHRVDINTFEHLPASALTMNDIAFVHIQTSKPLFFDPYSQNRTMGSFILVDPVTNATVAAGMIHSAYEQEDETAPERVSSAAGKSRRNGLSAAVWVIGSSSLAADFERAILQQGWEVQLVSRLEFSPAELKAIAAILQRRGVIPILSLPKEDPELKQDIMAIFGEDSVFEPEPSTLHPESINTTANWLDQMLTRLNTKEAGHGSGTD